MTPVPVAFEITPLTHKGRDNKVYERRDFVISQLEELAKATEEEIASRIKVKDEEDAGSIKSEALIFLYKLYLGTDLAGVIYETLSVRIGRMLFRFRKDYSMSETDLEEFIQEINFNVLEKISSDKDDGDYAQVSFGEFVIGLASNSSRKYAKRRDRGKVTDSIDDKYEESENSPPKIQLRVGGTTPEEEILIKEAVRALEEPHRTTWLMYHLWGFQIDSKDPKEKTIAQFFHVTGRTVRNRLRAAEETLKGLERGL